MNGHVAVKYLYVRIFRNDKDNIMQQKTFRAYGAWILICTALWVIAWIIAEAVPVFEDLLGLTGALFASWFTYGLSGMFWLKMNFECKGWRPWTMKRRMKDGAGKDRIWGGKKWILLAVNVLNIIVATCIVSLMCPDEWECWWRLWC